MCLCMHGGCVYARTYIIHTYMIYTYIKIFMLIHCHSSSASIIIGRKTRTHILEHFQWRPCKHQSTIFIVSIVINHHQSSSIIIHHSIFKDKQIQIQLAANKMFQNVRPSFPSDYEWLRWWMTMTDDYDRDDDDDVWHYLTLHYITLDFIHNNKTTSK